jgi:hypothetical protein
MERGSHRRGAESSRLRRVSALPALIALSVVGCSRAALRDRPGEGEGGAAAGGAGTGASGVGGAGTGGGGAAGFGGFGGAEGPPCDVIEWQDEVVVIPATVGGFAVRPRLVRVGVVRLALVFEAPVFDATLLASALVDPWDDWPPTVSAVDANFPSAPTWNRFPVSHAEGDSFAFAAPQGNAMALGLAEPGQNGSTFVDWPTPNEEAKTLARSNAGSYLVGRGPPTGLVVDLLPGFVPDPVPLVLGGFGCASPFVSASAVGVEDAAFLVATTADLPNDDCADPDVPGAPRFVQVWRVSASGVAPGAWFEASAPVLEVALSGRIGGAWLSYRPEGSETLHIAEVDANGNLVAELGSFGNPTYEDAVIAWFEGFAHATTYGGGADVGPFVSIEVSASAGVASATLPLVSPPGRVSVASSSDGDQFLVAFELANEGAIGLARAQCFSVSTP